MLTIRIKKQYLIMFLTLTITGLFYTSHAVGQFPVQGQNSAYPLVTAIDNNELKNIASILSFENFNINAVAPLRQRLKPLIDKQDVLAEWFYACTFDLFPYGFGKAEDTTMALSFYKKAADQNLVFAEKSLYGIYRHGYMNKEPSFSLGIQYLQRLILHGDSTWKAYGYSEYAQMHASGDVPGINKNSDSAIFYLKRSLSFKPDNEWGIDFLASLYQEKKMYDKALELYMKSTNINSQVTAARWLMAGEKVKKNPGLALKLLYAASDKVIQEYGMDHIRSFGGDNPLYLLNDWCRCKKLISKDELGKYYLEFYMCD